MAEDAITEVTDESGENTGDSPDERIGNTDDGTTSTTDGTTEATDWRDGITSEEGRKFAEGSTDLNHLAERAAKQRVALSNAITKPGKDATEEDIALYRQQLGVPETYTFNSPNGEEPTEQELAFQETASELFSKHNISQEQADGLSQFWYEAHIEAEKMEIEQDAEFARQSEAQLRKDWPGEEYDRNKHRANLAAQHMFGAELEEARTMQTKDGKIVLDHPVMLRALAQIGAEMTETGRLDVPMTDSKKNDIQNQIYDLEKQIDQAEMESDYQKKTELYKKQTELYDQLYGTGTIVGGEGRVV